MANDDNQADLDREQKVSDCWLVNLRRLTWMINSTIGLFGSNTDGLRPSKTPPCDATFCVGAAEVAAAVTVLVTVLTTSEAVLALIFRFALATPEFGQTARFRSSLRIGLRETKG